MIANALSSLGHIDEVVDYSLAIYFFFAAIPVFFIIRADISKTNYKKKLITSAVCLVFLGVIHLLFLPHPILKTSFIKYSPVNYVRSLYDYFGRFHRQMNQGVKRVSLSNFYEFSRQKKTENLNIILVIGESLRADHVNLNGYTRVTMPRMATTPNLLNFTVAASFNATTGSLTSMLSHRTKADFVDIPPEKSIVALFGEIGFKTHWYSAQSSKEFGNGMLTILASEAEDYFFRDRLQAVNRLDNIYDEALLPYLDKVVQGSGDNFVVLHTFGSHIRTHNRYPKNFKIFQPECLTAESSCKDNEVLNSYDNSVLYTDYFLSRVIDSLKNTNSILFFVSDHGIFLGENGVYANGNSDQSDSVMNQVPMFFYMTDKLVKNKFYREKFAFAKNKIALKNLSHDNLFDSLLDCAGVDSGLFVRGLSICQE